MQAAFTAVPLSQLPHMWSVSRLFLHAMLCYLLMQISLLITVPLGVFVPLLAVGASLGRAIGEILVGFGVASVAPWSLAVVGAAAMAGGTTHTLSTILVVAELTGDLSLLPGTALAVLASIGVANKLSVSFYDSGALAANLPYFPVPSSLSLYKCVGDVMTHSPPCVARFADVSKSNPYVGLSAVAVLW